MALKKFDYYFFTLGNHDPEEGLKIRKIYKNWVFLVIRAVTIWQTVMQKNSVKALYQDRASLKQVTGFAAFSRNVSQLIFGQDMKGAG